MNRIKPTHFIEIWRCPIATEATQFFYNITKNYSPESTCTTANSKAVFLIKEQSTSLSERLRNRKK
jgi:hypothetical protein